MNASTILVLLALILSVLAFFPAVDSFPLLAVAVVLVCVALLVGDPVGWPR